MVLSMLSNLQDHIESYRIPEERVYGGISELQFGLLT